MLVTSLMLVGAAVDLARWLNARDNTLSAIESAALAGGRVLQTDANNQPAAIALAKRYYDQAVANRVQYGLTSSILAADTYKAFELAPKLLHGIVNVNSPTVNDEIHAPMGGVRESGWGRTGPDSLADFTDVIWINTTSSERQFPF